MGDKGRLTELIQMAIMFGQFNQLDGILVEAMESNVKPSIIRNGYEQLGDFHVTYKRWYQASLAYENGRKLVQYLPRHVQKAFHALEKYLSDINSELCVNDLQLIKRFIEDLLAQYGQPEIRNFYSPAVEIGEVILGEITKRLETASSNTRSRFSGELIELILGKYPFLTEEERKKEFGRIVGKAIIKAVKKKTIEKPQAQL